MENEVITLYRKFNVAMAADDVAQLSKLLAADFTLTHMTGYVQPRAEWLAQVGNGQMHYFSSVEEHVTVKVLSKTSWQVTGQNQVTAEIHGGARHVWPLNTVMTIQQIDGKLQIKQSVVTTY
ncbi:nuclear transport factor 2 family protein [Lactiplantibacillus sp. WILCCON 0030]|uniref:Nuclear transport factor 2 family protein n=1 Tax=Lactiplantibacillus brownii TaxID=3069269 RepID=A0ABU1AAQ0_9LACO|nr:nuclear transport factor 2 family protein [Lactiplantibacillus brownii]MDQ7937963.1 nuclear transport factor 2 family protein [Lactiplantibacillus brownii]